jgi:hypothetical protein
MPRYLKLSLSFRLPFKQISFNTCHKPSLSHYFDVITRTLFSAVWRSRKSSLCDFVQSLVILISGQNIFLQFSLDDIFGAKTQQVAICTFPASKLVYALL